MEKNLYIDASHPNETRIVLKSDNSIEEYEFEDKNKLNFKNNIYLGTISRVEPSLQAAFVNFGRERHGFLAFNDIQSDYYQIPSEDKDKIKAAEEKIREDLKNKNLENSLENSSNTNSEEIKLKELKTTETVKPSSTSSSSTSRGKKTEDFSYKKLSVSNPADGSSIRSNSGNVSISVNSEPSLRSGHRILITMDGKELSKGTSKSVSLTNIDRGTHTITVSIVDSSSNTIISASSTFSILRASQ